MSQRDIKMIGGIYRIGQVISPSGMLTTYTAYNRNTNDIVGLFVVELPSHLQNGNNQALLQPFERRHLVQSPHVLRIHAWGIDGPRLYVATDPPRGITLHHVLDTENIELPRAIELIRQLAQGLQALHDQGLFGFDLRPQLITVDSLGINDRVQIDDIGLRNLLNTLGYVSNQQANDIGFLDPRYAPPEYMNPAQVGPWSDIYQLGLLLFEIVTGRPPFVGQNTAETGILQTTGAIPRMRQYKHNTPADLQEIVDHALAKDSHLRFATAHALLKALDSIQLPQPTLPIGFPPSTSVVRQPSRNLTTEMPRLGDDVTLMATQIEPSPNTEKLTTSEPGTKILVENDVYAYLCYEKDGKEVERIPLKQKNSIVGRTDPKRHLSPDIDLTALDPTMTISRQHARIRFEETFFYIEDLKSRNKTRLGSLVLSPLKPELLQNGDIIFFGSVRMKFEIPNMGKAVSVPE